MPQASPFFLSTSSFLLLLLATRQWKVNAASLSHHGQERRGAGFPFPISTWWRELINRAFPREEGRASGKVLVLTPLLLPSLEARG